MKTWKPLFAWFILLSVFIINNMPTFHLTLPQAPQQRDLKPSMTSLPQSLPTASNSSTSSSSQLLNNLPPGISVQKGTEPQTSSPSQVLSLVTLITTKTSSWLLSQLLQKLPPGITIQKGLQEPPKPQSPVIQQQQQGTSSFTIQVSLMFWDGN